MRRHSDFRLTVQTRTDLPLFDQPPAIDMLRCFQSQTAAAPRID